MEINIREIDENDYHGVLSIGNKELGCNHSIEDYKIYYNRVKKDERYKTFVALEKEEVVGFITSVYSFEIGKKVGFMHIVGLAVKNEKQNQGIGTKLLEHMENYAKEKGISSIVLNSGVQRTAAHAFYQCNEYGKNSWCFNKKL
ncbi:MAG: GNAT family N-acetyltransferase [Acutalibacteraceae bacterium]